MSHTVLLSGPPGCGKTTWILSQIQSHRGPSGYLRVTGYPDEGLAQARDGGLDLAALQFGFIELDCALLHGSSADVGDWLGPESSPLLLLDRLTRMDVNRLFTARSGEQFCVELAGGGIASTVRDLAGERQLQQVVPQRKVIGIGGGLRYSLYDPGSDRIAFRSVGQQPGSRGRGFA